MSRLRTVLLAAFLVSCTGLVNGGSTGGGGGSTSGTGGGSTPTRDAGTALDGGSSDAGTLDAGMPAIGFTIPAGFDGGATLYGAVGLRGYGTATGKAWELSRDADSASVTLIHAIDEAHASLWVAKYVSDLQSLGGVTAATVAGHPGWNVTGQGVVLAFSAGPDVALIAGSSEATVKTVLGQLTTDAARTWNSTATIPIYLDRWDQHAFNFYHYPAAAMQEADPLAAFDYAKAHGGTGFVVQDGALDLAPGLMSNSFSLWR